jgi:hypothetical protein
MINIDVKHIAISVMLFVSMKEIFNGIDIINLDGSMVNIFLEWGFSAKGVISLGIITIMGGVLLLIPYTFVWANCLIASKSFLVVFLYLLDSNIKAAFWEFPLLFLIVVMIYFKYPFSRQYKIIKILSCS